MYTRRYIIYCINTNILVNTSLVDAVKAEFSGYNSKTQNEILCIYCGIGSGRYFYVSNHQIKKTTTTGNVMLFITVQMW